MTDQTLLSGAGVAWVEDEPVPAKTALHLLDGVPVEIKRLFTDQADWANGGPTSYGNGQGLCVACNHAKQATTAQARAAPPTLAA